MSPHLHSLHTSTQNSTFTPLSLSIPKHRAPNRPVSLMNSGRGSKGPKLYNNPLMTQRFFNRINLFRMLRTHVHNAFLSLKLVQNATSEDRTTWLGKKSTPIVNNKGQDAPCAPAASTISVSLSPWAPSTQYTTAVSAFYRVAPPVVAPPPLRVRHVRGFGSAPPCVVECRLPPSEPHRVRTPPHKKKIDNNGTIHGTSAPSLSPRPPGPHTPNNPQTPLQTAARFTSLASLDTLINL